MRHGDSISKSKKLKMIHEIKNAAREVIRLNGGKDVKFCTVAEERAGKDKT